MLAKIAEGNSMYEITIVMVAIALFFLVNAAVAVFLLRSAPKLQGLDPARRLTTVKRQQRVHQKAKLDWTQWNHSAPVHKKRSEGSAASGSP